jgi:hypothetical protein
MIQAIVQLKDEMIALLLSTLPRDLSRIRAATPLITPIVTIYAIGSFLYTYAPASYLKLWVACTWCLVVEWFIF